jgi:hypothetical protein
VNGPGRELSPLRAEVRAALAGDGLEQVVRDLLELRFPAAGPGASLDEAATALGMSPALVAHIEFSALCALAAARPQPSATISRGPAPRPGPGTAGGGRA